METRQPIVEEFVEITPDGRSTRRVRKTFDYRVARGGDENKLRHNVLDLYEQGYRPCGGVAFRGDSILFQAMIKETIDRS